MSNVAERRERARRNRHQFDDPMSGNTSNGRLLQERRAPAAIVSPPRGREEMFELEPMIRTSSRRFEPTYLDVKPMTSIDNMDGIDYDGDGPIRSGSWEEAEAEWSASVSIDTVQADNYKPQPEVSITAAVTNNNSSRNQQHVTLDRITSGSTDGDDSLFQSEDEEASAINRYNKQQQLQQLRAATTSSHFEPSAAAGLNNDINVLNLKQQYHRPPPTDYVLQQQKQAANQQKQPNANPYSATREDEISTNGNSVESFQSQLPVPILRKTESYKSIESVGGSDTDDEGFRRRVKFRETTAGALRNTIHEYEDDSLTAYTEQTGDSMSTATREPAFPSLLNEGMEDALLDFFFLGQSARPRPRKKKKTKNKRSDGKKASLSSRSSSRHDEESSNEDDGTAESQTTMDAQTINTAGSSNYSRASDPSIVSNDEAQKKRQSKEKLNKEPGKVKNDPFQMVDNFCQLVISSCGTVPKPPDFVTVTSSKKNNVSEDQSMRSTKSNGSETDANPNTTTTSNTWRVFDVDQNVFVEAQTNLIVMAYRAQNWYEEKTGYKVSENSVPADVANLYSPSDASTFATIASTDTFDEADIKQVATEEEVEVNDEQELENGLLELVKCAARSKHLQNGLVFDESYDIDVTTEVKFIVVSTSLPLGVLFKENSGGCSVTRVFKSKNDPDGTSAKLPVDVGDQLTAINGKSAMKKSVSQVCAMMNSSLDPKTISLTFLRYTGVFHSNSEKLLPQNKLGSPVAAAVVVTDSDDTLLENREISLLPEKEVLSAAAVKMKEPIFVKTDVNKKGDINKMKHNERPPQQVKESNHQMGENVKTSNASRQPLQAWNPNITKTNVTASALQTQVKKGHSPATEDKKKKGFMSLFKRKKKES